MAKDGQTLAPGSYDGMLADYPVELIPVDPSFLGRDYSYFNVGRVMWTEAPPVLQILWPDAQGRQPTHPDFEPTLMLLQPLLWAKARK